MIKEVLRMFQGSFKGVSRKFQGCFNGDLNDFSSVFERSSRSVLGKFQRCFLEVSRGFPGNFNIVSGKIERYSEKPIQGSFKGISRSSKVASREFLC